MPLSTVATQAEQIAREAGLLARSLFGTALTITPKELPHDVVTNADYAVEELIVSQLHAQFPADGFIAEESGNTGDDTAAYRWIIDPIDGTVNFSQHISDFGVMICRAHGDQLELGVIYLPMDDVMIVGERGQGVWCNGTRVQPVVTQELSTIAPIVGVNAYRPGLEQLSHLVSQWKGAGHASLPTRRSAAVNTALIVRGESHGYFTNMHSPWDIAPMHVLLPELGYTFMAIGTTAMPTWNHVSGAYAAVPAAVVDQFRAFIAGVV